MRRSQTEKRSPPRFALELCRAHPRLRSPVRIASGSGRRQPTLSTCAICSRSWSRPPEAAIACAACSRSWSRPPEAAIACAACSRSWSRPPEAAIACAACSRSWSSSVWLSIRFRSPHNSMKPGRATVHPCAWIFNQQMVLRRLIAPARAAFVARHAAPHQRASISAANKATRRSEPATFQLEPEMPVLPLHPEQVTHLLSNVASNTIRDVLITRSIEEFDHPISPMTARSATPRINRTVAAVCLASCRRPSRRPARLSRRFHSS